jgi:hypothetical protein
MFSARQSDGEEERNFNFASMSLQEAMGGFF